MSPVGSADIPVSVRRRPVLARMAVTMLLTALVVASCRPSIADNGDGGDNGGPTTAAAPTDTPAPTPTLAPGQTPGPTESPEPTVAITPEVSTTVVETALPALALKPTDQVNVEVQLFTGFGPDVAPLQYGEALDRYRPVNLIVNLAPPIVGYDPFQVAPAPDVVPLWVGTVADMAPSAASGRMFEAVGELTGRDSTVLVTRKGGPTSPAAVKGPLLADTPGAVASFLGAGGIASAVKVELPDDPSAPFDPTDLISSKVKAAVVSVFDGWARIEEAAVAAGLKASAFQVEPLRTPAQSIAGELIWAQPSDLSDPQLHAAVAAFLGTVGQSEVDCRDAIEDCASVASAQSDRQLPGIEWSINVLDGLLFPSSDGILHIDDAEWTRTQAAMTTAGVKGLSNLTYTNDIVNAVLAALSSLDVHGATWKPRTDLPLFP
jgi:hypothetical protein